jgi:hypothetical protein
LPRKNRKTTDNSSTGSRLAANIGCRPTMSSSRAPYTTPEYSHPFNLRYIRNIYLLAAKKMTLIIFMIRARGVEPRLAANITLVPNQ